MGYFMHYLQIFICAQAAQPASITKASYACNQSILDIQEEHESEASALRLLQIVKKRASRKMVLPQRQRGYKLDDVTFRKGSASETDSKEDWANVDLQIPEESRVDTVRVDIYYETKCPFCIMFLNTTLREAWDDPNLTNRLDLRLYPFGNAMYVPEASISEGYHFWHPRAKYPLLVCQHEDAECFGNMVQACALDIYPNRNISIPYVICMASYGTDYGLEKTSYECGGKLGIDMKLLKACAWSEYGSRLIEQIADETSRAFTALHAAGVPLMAVQGSQTDDRIFFQTVCAWLKEPRPSTCSQYLRFISDAADVGVSCGETSNSSKC